MNQLAKALPTQAIDENGNVIKFTNKQLEQYLLLEKNLKVNLFQAAKALMEIKEKKYYLLRGYFTFAEYCQDAVAYSYKTVQQYLLVEEKYNGVIKDIEKYPITKLVKIAKTDEKLERLKQAEDKEGYLLQLMEESTEEPEKREVIEVKPIGKMRQYREDIELFVKYVESGEYLSDSESIKDLHKIYQSLTRLWTEIEPIIMSKIDEEKPVEVEVKKESATEQGNGNSRKLKLDDLDKMAALEIVEYLNEIQFNSSSSGIKNKALTLLIERFVKEMQSDKPDSENASRTLNFLSKVLPEYAQISHKGYVTLDGILESFKTKDYNLLLEVLPIEFNWL